MNSKTSNTSSTTMETALVEPAMATNAGSQAAWEYCLGQLRDGNHEFCIPDCLLEATDGNLGMKGLVHALGSQGYCTCISYNPGLGWVVCLLKENEPQLPLPMQPGAAASPQEAPKRATVTAGRKAPPRPMNCFLLYRDSMHKQLKAENPYLTVQEISTICSATWKNLPPAEKDNWRAEAKMAKEEHQRMYPEYRYTPRKPGQKKRRQSRKAAHAAAAAAASVPVASTPMSNLNVAPEASMNASNSSTPSAGFGPEVFDFNSFPDTSVSAADANSASEAAMNDITTNNTANSLTNNRNAAAEVHRQRNLAAEFENDSHSSQPRALAFRTGADQNATLLESFEPLY